MSSNQKDRIIMKKINKILLILVSAVLTAATLITMPTPIFALNENKAYNWYVKRNTDHTLPTLPSEFSFILESGGIYGDRTAANTGDKVIYLTFDAGYENGNIERILDTLKKHNVPGAFFILENLVIRNTELVKRMASEGHLVCNHTLKHPDMTKLTEKAKFDLQLSSLSELIKDKCGFECAKFYRPPEGRFSEQNLKYASELGYKTVFWSFAYADWDNNKQPSRDDAVKKILENVHPGEIMLLHPTSKTNADILDEVLTALKKDGYRFGSLTEINV